MHYSAKRSIVIACRLSVRLSVSDVDGSGSHRLESCTDNSPTFALRSPKAIHLLPGEHGEILGRLEVGFCPPLTAICYYPALHKTLGESCDDVFCYHSLDTILSYLPKQRRTGLFSATQTREVDDLIRAGLRNPVHIAVKERLSATSDVEQKTPATLHNYYMVDIASWL